MTDTDDALVERVAKAMCGCDGVCFTSCATEPCQMAKDNFGNEARAAIAVLRPVIRAEALDEAAKAVDEMPLGYPGNAAETALEIAAAIRALKEEKHAAVP